MTQIFIIGSSSAYGVGGKDGGWADILKQRLHTLMYGEQGVGEKHELFNFAKAGEPISFVLRNLNGVAEQFKRTGKTIAVVSIGGNNSKAENEPENFVSTPAQYQQEMTSLLMAIRSRFDEVVFLGSGSVDESKTNPKPNPLTGGCSYFSNARRTEFEKILIGLCSELKITFLPVSVPADEWIREYLYSDGLHPNDKGHQYMADLVWEHIKTNLS
jgi:lysophospholipase L1-like esterase